MDLDAGPERRVRTPGASERAESREVAKVRVTKGRDVGAIDDPGWEGGRRGSRLVAHSDGKVSSSAMTAEWDK